MSVVQVQEAWAKYLATLRHDTYPPHTAGWDNYEHVERFAWALLQHDLGEAHEHPDK